MLFCIHHTFCKFQIVYSSRPPKISLVTFFKSGTFCLIFSHNSLKMNFFVRLKYFFAINQFQTMQHLHLWKKFWKKIYFAFSKKFPWFIEWPSYLLNDFRICNNKFGKKKSMIVGNHSKYGELKTPSWNKNFRRGLHLGHFST